MFFWILALIFTVWDWYRMQLEVIRFPPVSLPLKRPLSKGCLSAPLVWSLHIMCLIIASVQNELE